MKSSFPAAYSGVLEGAFPVRTRERDLGAVGCPADDGLVYWYGIYPIHALIFRGMIRKLSELAERESEGNKTDLSSR
jgi:hypothetical protein